MSLIGGKGQHEEAYKESQIYGLIDFTELLTVVKICDICGIN